MKNEFVKYEQALALRELGFDEPCLFHTLKGEINFYNPFSLEYNIGVSAILCQQAFRWFREKHKQDSLVVPSGDSTGKTNGYYYEIVFDFSKENIESESFKTYEEAESACLDKLIEIFKTKTNEK